LKKIVGERFRSPTFLYYRTLRESNLAVLLCFDTNENWIGKQLPVGVAHFFISSVKPPIFQRRFTEKGRDFSIPS
jgi:hypothetical protein